MRFVFLAVALAGCCGPVVPAKTECIEWRNLHGTIRGTGAPSYMMVGGGKDSGIAFMVPIDDGKDKTTDEQTCLKYRRVPTPSKDRFHG